MVQSVLLVICLYIIKDGLQLISAAVFFILLEFKTINLLIHYDIIPVAIGLAKDIKIYRKKHTIQKSGFFFPFCLPVRVRACVRVCVCVSQHSNTL